MKSIRSNSLSLKYYRFTRSGCKDIGIRKIEFVGENLGEIAVNTMQSLDVIDSKHSVFCKEIEQCISEVLLARGIILW